MTKAHKIPCDIFVSSAVVNLAVVLVYLKFHLRNGSECELSSELAKGVYKGPDGSSRYWDGESWFNIEVETPLRKPSFLSRYGKQLVALLIAAILVSGGVILVSKQQATKQRNLAAAAAAAALVAQQDVDNQERSSRQLQVNGIEASVLKMAKDNASTGVIEGPILSVSCAPVAGGSMTDITATTTKFECFAVYKINSDGTSNGYYYNATINWQSGTYTYGYGRA